MTTKQREELERQISGVAMSISGETCPKQRERGTSKLFFMRSYFHRPNVDLAKREDMLKDKRLSDQGRGMLEGIRAVREILRQ